MEKKLKLRDSNFELLRCISMFMIVVTHVIVHGYVIEHVNGMTHTVTDLLKCILYVHVNSFILVTGYYQCKGKFKLNKIFQLNNAAWFYGIAIALIIIGFNLYPISKLDMFRLLLPIQLEGYWFIKMYIYLYCLTPVLNLVIDNINQKYHKRIIYVGILLFSIVPTITNKLTFDNDRGFSLPSFVLLYFIGAYFRKYPIDKTKLFEKFSKNKQVVTVALVFIGSVIFNFLLHRFGHSLNHGEIIGEIRKVIVNSTFAYDNPLLLLSSVSYFLLFYYIRFQSKFINNIGKLVLGVYLIHEQFIFNDFFYRYFGFADILGNGWKVSKSLSVFIPMFATSIFIFIVCLIIEWIRQKLFKFIYDRKLSTKLREKFYHFIETF